MARRTPNIYPETLKSGKTVYRVMLTYRDPQTGRRKQQMKTFPTKREAQVALAENTTARSRGDDAPPARMLLDALLDEWLEAKREAVKPNTYTAYRISIENHIRPHLGKRALGSLTTRQIQLYYTTLRKQGVGPWALRAVHARLSDVLHYACRQHIIAANPLQGVDRPFAAEHQHQVWNDDEVRRVLAASDKSHYGPIWLVALYTGMRRGELTGLRWCDVDEEAGVLHVRQQCTRDLGRPCFAEPKRGSKRDICVPGIVFAALRQHRAMQLVRRLEAGNRWQDYDLVFPGSHGQPLHDYYIVQDLRRIVAAAGVRSVTTHDVRHTHGSMLMRRGKNPKQVAERLGHKHASLTLDTYTHAIPEEHKQTARDLEQWLAG